MRNLAALILAFLSALAVPGRALDPLPEFWQGPGFKTWTIQADKPLLRLETVMHDLRLKDAWNYPKVLDALGIQKVNTGRSRSWPDFVQPMHATTQFLGFERRKMAILSMPVRGRHQWYAVILRQEGNNEAYWRARQVFVFDTDPVEGFRQDFPDVNGEDIHFWMPRHLIQDHIYGRARVDSLFRWDERGRLRLTFQELADAYRPGKYQGQAERLQQILSFPGNQSIRRTLEIRSYPWMKREEWERYSSVDAPQVPAAKVFTVREDFVWNPVDFNFYGQEQELAKLVTHPSPYIRREAARRLGEHMKTTHPQLEKALLEDKDAYVRIQCALALQAIGDPAALPAVEKALKNWDEPDNVREALEAARQTLVAFASDAKGAGVEATPSSPAKRRRKPAAKPKPGMEAALPAPEGVRISPNK